jgi:hypothetical protein
MPEGQRVGLADLGRIYFDLKKEDANLLSPIPNDQISKVTKLKMRAFVWKAVTISVTSNWFTSSFRNRPCKQCPARKALLLSAERWATPKPSPSPRTASARESCHSRSAGRPTDN